MKTTIDSRLETWRDEELVTMQRAVCKHAPTKPGKTLSLDVRKKKRSCRNFRGHLNHPVQQNTIPMEILWQRWKVRRGLNTNAPGWIYPRFCAIQGTWWMVFLDFHHSSLTHHLMDGWKEGNKKEGKIKKTIKNANEFACYIICD